MCIHIAKELLEEIEFWHEQGDTMVSGVQMYSPSGRFVGSWVCLLDQPQSIAQAVHALRTWHPGKANHVNLGLVNVMRDTHRLKPLGLQDLPPPQPLAIESLDNDSRADTRAEVTRWLAAARATTYGTARAS